jgi:hypothetical protein
MSGLACFYRAVSGILRTLAFFCKTSDMDPLSGIGRTRQKVPAGSMREA